MVIKYNLRNRQILKKVDGKYMKPKSLNRLYKTIRNIISSNKQQISKFEAEKLINLIYKKTKEIPEINLIRLGFFGGFCGWGVGTDSAPLS